MTLARCAYPNCGLTRLSTIHWTDDPNQEIAHGSHEYREPTLDRERAGSLDVELAEVGRVAVAVVTDWIGDPDHGFVLDALIAPVEAYRAALAARLAEKETT